METENKDWKPEVGKTAWLKRYSDQIEQVMITADYTTKLHYKQMIQIGEGEVAEYYLAQDRDYFFESPEAALASIKIYDLEGKEVVITRAQDKIIIEMCDRAAEQIAYLSDWDDADYAQLGMAPIINAFKEIIAVRDRAAIKMVAKLVYEMNLPDNPEGEARLKAAQERFKSAIGGKSDQREGGC